MSISRSAKKSTVPLRLVETSLRYGQQVLLASRLKQEHVLAVAKQLDACGFAALDVFGGPTFEACLQFARQNPFDRLRAIREVVSSTPLRGNIAGQALVTSHHVSDDLVDEFVKVGARCGIDIFRCYDPINDVRNLEYCVKKIHKLGKKIEGVVIYNHISHGEEEHLCEVAEQLSRLECDMVVLHDPVGELNMVHAAGLTKALMSVSKCPVGVSFPYHYGQADLAAYAAVEAGASQVDVALSPLSGGFSYPSAEGVSAALAGTRFDPQVDVNAIFDASATLEALLPEYFDILEPRVITADTPLLSNALPYDAVDAALNVLNEMDSRDKAPALLDEVQRVQSELGHPPLSSSIAQMIATQAAYNLCDGDRYSTITQEVKDYCLNFYGTPPQSIDRDIQHLVNGNEEPITCRPADLLEPIMDKARQEASALTGEDTSGESAVAYALFSEAYNVFAQQDAENIRDETNISTNIHDDEIGDGKQGEEIEQNAIKNVRDLTVEVDGVPYSVRIHGMQPVSSDANSPLPPVRGGDDGVVMSPMQGIIVKINVSAGEPVHIGDVVVVLEAMKMQNDIMAPASGRVGDVYVMAGQAVFPKDPLVRII